MVLNKKIVNFFRKNYVILLIILILLVIFFYSYYSKGAVYSIANSDSNSVIEFIDSFGYFSYIIFIFFVILEVVLAPIPALALYVAGGAIFGTVFGSILTLIGNLIGALIAFWIARRIGRNFVEKRVNPTARRKFDAFSERYGVLALFILRINPFTTSDIFSYISGLTKMKVKNFLLGTGLGLAPMIFVQAYFGEAFVKSHPTLYVILIWVSIAYFLAFVYLILITFFKNKEIPNKNPEEKS